MTSGITPISHQALHTLDICTNGRGFSRIDPTLSRWISTSGIEQGVLNLTCLHTSASLTINENADPRVLKDLAAWMDDMVPESRGYLHDDEGPDDMPAHIRTALTCQTLSLSVERGRLLLGTWQAVYLWEHRRAPHQRRIACHLIGTRAHCWPVATACGSTKQSRPVMTLRPGPPTVASTQRWICWWTACTTWQENEYTRSAHSACRHC